MMFTIFLSIWRLVGLIAWPVLILHPRARRHMLRLPVPTPGRTWVHGASLGEHRAIEALAPHLGPSWITSSSWRTPVPFAFPAPLDLPLIIGPWLDRARPSRLVLVEAEFWPGWISACRKRGIPISVVSARRGDGYRRWQWLRPVFRQMLAGVQVLDAADWGDLKTAPTPLTETISLPQRTVIGASTRPGDEEVLLTAWAKLRAPRPLLVLAPRHLDRVQQILAICRPFSPLLWSKADRIPSAGILIIDTLGELEGFITSAHAVFIGGTLDPKIGGHSPIAAASAGAHILAGPHRHANPEAWSGLQVHMPDQVQSWTEVLQHTVCTDRPPPQQWNISVDAIVDQLPAGVSLPERSHRPWLRFLAPLWSGLSAIDRALKTPQQLPRPTIVVGGMVAGGAGRTPVAGWLAEAIPKSVILSAGYKRSGKGREVRVPQTSDSIGDELEMLHRQGQSVISAPCRIQGMHAAPADSTIIIDGAFSDRRLSNAYRIAVIDIQRPTGGGLIPAGSQRLPWTELRRADAIWLTHCTDGAAVPHLPTDRPVVRSQLRPVAWIHQGKTKPLSARVGEVDVAVGIASPERFICTLLDLGLKIRSLHRAGDHGALGTLKPGTVVTEKDAARLPIQADVWALKMEVDAQGTETLLKDLAVRLS